MTSTTKNYYWAITEKGKALFNGTFSECWTQLNADFSHWTIARMESEGIRISRVK